MRESMLGRSRYKYDAALSFSGEDRAYAERLAKSLKRHGVNVFYDRDHIAHLWGKRKSEYEGIYGPYSRYVIPLISSSYAKRDWCQLEFGIAKDEAKRRQREFILPIRVDDTRILGLHDDANYLDSRRVSLREVVQSVLQKLGREHPRDCRSSGSASENGHVAILAEAQRFALGLISTSPMPLSPDSLTKLFPEVHWPTELRALRRHGLILHRHQTVYATPTVRRTLSGDTKEVLGWKECWISRLEPLRSSPDCAVMLAVLCLTVKRYDVAAAVLADVSYSPEPSSWDSILLSVLNRFAESKIAHRFSRASLLQIHNARGLCLSRLGDHGAAVQSFAKLLVMARRWRDSWFLGQAYINGGIAYEHTGDVARAEKWYRRAILHSGATRDSALRAHAMSNLANLIMSRDRQAARELLRKALQMNRINKDYHAIGSTLLAIGNLSAANGEFGNALRVYARIERLALSKGFAHLRCLAIHNRGRALADLRRYRDALCVFRRARTLATRCAYSEGLYLSMEGEADTELRLKRYRRAEHLFSTLASERIHKCDVEGAIAATYNSACAAVKGGRVRAGRHRFERVWHWAAKEKLWEWVQHARVGACVSYVDGQDIGGALLSFAKAAREEERLARFGIAVRLWLERAEVAFDHGRLPDAACSVEHALRIGHRRVSARAHLAEAYELLYHVSWSGRQYSKALRALDSLADIARSERNDVKRIEAIDQKGVCLQELGRGAEAEKYHRLALSSARRLKQRREEMVSLMNLGELLRRRGQARASASLSSRAERNAIELGDQESALRIRHNRALALEDCGDAKAAAKMLRSCLRDSRRLCLWTEAVRALHGLANLSQTLGRPSVAQRHYSAALRMAAARGVTQEQLGIAINYGHSLNHSGQYRKAERVLSRLAPGHDGQDDTHLLFSVLAESYEGAGRSDLAREAWMKSKEGAKLVRDRKALAMAAEALAVGYEANGNAALAEAEFRDAIDNVEGDAHRAELMVSHMAQLCKLGRHKAVERRFEETRTLLEKCGLAERYVDLHMLLGDYLWKKGVALQIEAMKAYVAGMAKALAVDVDAFISVGGHIWTRLQEVDPLKRSCRIDAMRKGLESWLLTQADVRRMGLTATLLWPLRAAQQSLFVEQAGKRLSARVIAAIFRQALGERQLLRSHG